MEENNKSLLTAETSTNDDLKLTALFTAGTAVFAVGLKRATVVFLLKQWELWIFFLLNILLLAILFCSSRSQRIISCSKDKTIRKRSTSRPNLEAATEEEEFVSSDDHYNSYYKLKKSEPTTSDFCDNREGLVENVTADDVSELSDEELNERVESFIASFKKQLVLDAKK